MGGVLPQRRDHLCSFSATPCPSLFPGPFMERNTEQVLMEMFVSTVTSLVSFYPYEHLCVGGCGGPQGCSQWSHLPPPRHRMHYTPLLPVTFRETTWVALANGGRAECPMLLWLEASGASEQFPTFFSFWFQ